MIVWVLTIMIDAHYPNSDSHEAFNMHSNQILIVNIVEKVPSGFVQVVFNLHLEGKR